MEEAQTHWNAWDTGEAQKVLQFASNYLHTWPKVWGKFVESEVCILASSHQQVSCGGGPHTDTDVLTDIYVGILQSQWNSYDWCEL